MDSGQLAVTTIKFLSFKIDLEFDSSRVSYLMIFLLK